MIDYTEISHEPDGWEQFARDFLQTIGFYIESTVDRGADQGKDMLITEPLKGALGRYRLRWLVSCKHFSRSGRSVSEADEPNILERMRTFKADGFIGFYSTLASSGLNTRLRVLRDGRDIRDYSIMDGRWIENHLVTAGFGTLVLRYFPVSYRQVKPLHPIGDRYQPLNCKVCGKDLLMDLFTSRQSGIVVHTSTENPDGTACCKAVYAVCKGDCDENIERREHQRGNASGWNCLDDLTIPVEFLRYVLAVMNKLQSGGRFYTSEAFDQERELIMTLSQRVLRYTTEEERQRFSNINALGL